MQLKSYLRKHGLTQKEFAEIMKVTEITVSRWVNGKSRTTVSMALEIERTTDGEVSAMDVLFPELVEIKCPSCGCPISIQA